jgi:hypothetical protein
MFFPLSFSVVRILCFTMRKTPSVWTAVFLLGGTTPTRAAPYSMPDLGYAEPRWSKVDEGRAEEDAIVVDNRTQVWGDVVPKAQGNPPLCKWTEHTDNNGKGRCRTDISWLHSAIGVDKKFFNNKLINYIIRFHLFGACYRTTVVWVHQMSASDATLIIQQWK